MEWDRNNHYPEDSEQFAGTPQRRKRRKTILSNPAIYILLICGISAILASLGWTVANDVLALNKDEATAVITIQEDDSFDSVVRQLKGSGIIQYSGMFKVFSTFAHGPDKIAAGTYELNTDMDYRAILSNLGFGSTSRMTTTVTIPEGYTVHQIFQLLQEKGVSSVDKLEEAAANHNYGFSFLKDIPLGQATRLEGYLFPDTYEFYMGEEPKYVINKMLVNFDEKLTDTMRQQVTDKGYTLGQVISIASMIEKETDGSDRGMIASVIYNRLNHAGGGTQGYLQVDATIQYVLPEGQIVSESDYDTVDSPYNTYKNKGLPPGPISNPGQESILAAINPEKTNYYYYALGDDGYHHFFSSYSEFQAFLKK